MLNFKTYIEESRKVIGSYSLTSQELSQYIHKTSSKIPHYIQDLLYLTLKYNLLDTKSIEDLREAPTSVRVQRDLSAKYNIPVNEIGDLCKKLHDLRQRDLRLMPQYQTPSERIGMETGKLEPDDLNVDLVSRQGRSEAVKMYMPIIYKIVGQYLGRSSMSKQELISSALQGMADAMNDWVRERENGKSVPFKTYVSYRVQQHILKDMNETSYTLSGTNWYAVKNIGSAMLSSIPISQFNRQTTDGGFENMLDNIFSEEPDTTHINDSDKRKKWNELFKLIENNFKTRNVDIFYRYFGLKGYKRERPSDIAKSIGESEPKLHNLYINRIISFLRKDKKAIEILGDIQDLYNESLMIGLIGMEKQSIIEFLINDDMYILLEELNRWPNKQIFADTLYNAIKNIKDKKEIIEMLKGDFITVDTMYKKYKKSIIEFLSNMYPVENMSKKTDVALIQYMTELQNMYQKYNK